jgi:hypothetical protein
VFEHAGSSDEYPDDLEAQAAVDCEGAIFTDYIGVAYEESELIVLYLTPTETSWGDGSRTTVCVVTTADDSLL